MSDPKLKEITTESLLEALNTKGEVKPIEIDYTNDILRFVKDINLEPGEENIKRYLLFRYFKQFYANNINRNQFHKVIANILDSNHHFYFIKNRNNHITLQLLHKLDIDKKTTPRHYRKYTMFLEKYKIKAGTTRYSLDFLYNLYKVYIKSTNRKAMTLRTFTVITYKSFKYVKTTKGNFMLLNKLTIDKHDLELVNLQIAEYEKKKQDQKGDKKVPRTR